MEAPAAAPLPLAKVAAGICIAAAVAGGGFYAYKRTVPPAAVTVAAVPQPAPAPVPVPPPEKVVEKTVEPAPAAPTVLASAPPAPAPAVATQQLAKPAKPAKQVTPSAIAKADTPARAPEVNETIARKVSLLLSKANGYVENKQYDKAIATAENVLELDPGSTAAQAMISKAKTRQLDALRSGSTLE